MSRYKENKTCSMCFVNVFKLKKKQVQDFYEIKIINKDFLEKPLAAMIIT